MLNDVRLGLRTLRKSPAFAIAAITTLALGIGANTAIFSVLNATLLRPLPYRDPSRLVFLQESIKGRSIPVGPATYYDWRAQANSYESMAAAQAWVAVLAGTERSEQIPAIRATAGLFEVLGAKPMLGRTFARDEDLPGKDQVVVLSYRLWQISFGADPKIVGRKVTLNAQPYTVIGVMPNGFEFPTFWAPDTRFWAPLSLAGQESRDERTLRIFARLKPGATPATAGSELSTIAARLARAYPESNEGVGAVVQRLHDRTFGGYRTMLLVLMGSVAFLLLIACSNVANLLLSRSAARVREIAVRMAIGASRTHLARMLLAESGVIGALGGALGVGLAFWGVPLIVRLLELGGRGTLPMASSISVDSRTLLFTAALAIASGLLFGLAPALQAWRVDLTQSMNSASRGSGSSVRTRLRSAFVVAQIAMSVVLLAGAGLLVRSFVRLAAVRPGFDPNNVLSMTIPYSGSQLGTPERRPEMYREVLRRVRSLPGVESASLVNHIPIAGDSWNVPVLPEGQTDVHPNQATALYRVAVPGYFHTMRIPLLAGRDISEQDKAGALPVAVINEAAARRYWGTTDAIGKRFRQDPQSPWVTIAGLIRDVRQSGLGTNSSPEVFFPYWQDATYTQMKGPFTSLTLVARVNGDPMAYVDPIRREIRSIDPGLAIAEVASLEQVVSNSLWQPRFSLTLIAFFAVLALALACVGVYGVVSYAVSQRTKEVGIRMALGAAPSDVLRMVLRSTLSLAAVGIVSGSGVAMGLTRAMASMLFETKPLDPLAFTISGLTLAAVALIASLGPARRAMSVQPVIALRYE
jgi:putative ABC transport system permease protein